MRALPSLVLGVAIALTARCVFAADTSSTAKPILLELFTSEGCSSCPPADAWVQKVDASQPIPNGQVIVLSEHVDYWNHDGWKDPFSAPWLTERQSSYAHSLKLSDIYTPQLIVDGTSELRLSNTQHTADVLSKAVASPTLPVRLISVNITPGNSPVVKGKVETDAGAGGEGAEVYLAIALDHAQSQVLRGENGGMHLSHVAVVESLKKLGKLEAGKSFAHDFEVKLKSGVDADNIRVVAFVQQPGPGKVLGAALLKPPLK